MDCPDRLWKHIAGILVCLCKTSERERLTWRSARNNIHLAQGPKVKISHIGFMDKLWIEILAKASAGPLVEFDKCAMLKPRLLQTFGKAAAATEQFKASHLNPIM